MGIFLSCFKVCSQNAAILETIPFDRRNRNTYMDTITGVIQEKEAENSEDEPHDAHTVRFRGSYENKVLLYKSNSKEMIDN